MFSQLEEAKEYAGIGLEYYIARQDCIVGYIECTGDGYVAIRLDRDDYDWNDGKLVSWADSIKIGEWTYDEYPDQYDLLKKMSEYGYTCFADKKDWMQSLKDEYDLFLVAFSGGKDSLACVLHLLEIGVPKSKIEIWHHRVDGMESDLLFDWECTDDYVRKFSQEIDIPLYYSWREGGLEREMTRQETPTAAVWFESPDGLKRVGGTSNKIGTRMQFPQTSASLTVRWCSSYAKISIMDVAIAHQERFKGIKTLVITGERRSESAARSKYQEFEAHRKNTKSRYVDHWRPVIDWSDADVWEIIERWSINPHPAYKLGWGRCSCMLCIFSSDDQLASAYKVFPERVQKMLEYEQVFGKTIAFKKVKGEIVQVSIMDRVKKGTAFNMSPEDIAQARSKEFFQPIFIENWKMPLGAFGDKAGPS